MKIDSDGGELWYEVAGSGPPLVVLPGGPGFSHDYLRPHLDPIDRHATMVWLDLPGTGRSELAAGAESITHARWIAALERLRSHLGFERWVVFGHSYGGFVAVEYALAHPRSVAGLVLCAAAPSPAHFATLLDRLPSELSAEDRRLLTALLTGQVPATELEARVREATRYFLRSNPPEETMTSFRLSPTTFGHALSACLPAVAFEDRLGEIAVPTLVVAGADDWQSPLEVTGRLAEGIPGAELAPISGAGHYPFIDGPDAVVEVVGGWLRRTAQA